MFHQVIRGSCDHRICTRPDTAPRERIIMGHPVHSRDHADGYGRGRQWKDCVKWNLRLWHRRTWLDGIWRGCLSRPPSQTMMNVEGLLLLLVVVRPVVFGSSGIVIIKATRTEIWNCGYQVPLSTLWCLHFWDSRCHFGDIKWQEFIQLHWWRRRTTTWQRRMKTFCKKMEEHYRQTRKWIDCGSVCGFKHPAALELDNLFLCLFGACPPSSSMHHPQGHVTKKQKTSTNCCNSMEGWFLLTQHWRVQREFIRGPLFRGQHNSTVKKID